MSRRKQFWEAVDPGQLMDPTPVEIPPQGKRPLPLKDEIQRMVQTAVSQVAAANGQETFEEADDFEEDEELYDLISPHTNVVQMIPEGMAEDDLNGEPQEPQDEKNSPPVDQPEPEKSAQQ